MNFQPLIKLIKDSKQPLNNSIKRSGNSSNSTTNNLSKYDRL